MLNIGTSNDCDAVVIFAKLEQFAYPSPMTFGCALMRPTHTGLRTNRDQLEHYYLTWYREGCLVKRADAWRGSVVDMFVI